MGKRNTRKGRRGNTKMAQQLADAQKPTSAPKPEKSEVPIIGGVFTAEDLKQMSAPAILKGMERVGKTTFRFMPGRIGRPGDRRIMLPSMRWARWAAPDLSDFKVGVGVGPTITSPVLEQRLSKAPGTFVMSKGGVIIPARAKSAEDVITPRTAWVPIGRGRQQEKREYVDKAFFKKEGNNVFVEPYHDQEQITVETWTGDFGRRVSDTALQLVQGGAFGHGSVALTGSDLIANAEDSSELPEGIEAATTRAEFLGEIPSEEVIDGHLRSLIRAWNMKYYVSNGRVTSEEIFARQYDKYYVVFVNNQFEADYYEYTGKDSAEQFARLTVKQKLVPDLDKAAKQKSESKRGARQNRTKAAA